MSTHRPLEPAEGQQAPSADIPRDLGVAAIIEAFDNELGWSYFGVCQCDSVFTVGQVLRSFWMRDDGEPVHDYQENYPNGISSIVIRTGQTGDKRSLPEALDMLKPYPGEHVYLFGAYGADQDGVDALMLRDPEVLAVLTGPQGTLGAAKTAYIGAVLAAQSTYYGAIGNPDDDYEAYNKALRAAEAVYNKAVETEQRLRAAVPRQAQAPEPEEDRFQPGVPWYRSTVNQPWSERRTEEAAQ